MIIAGPCSYIDSCDDYKIIKTAQSLINTADIFRCKLWLGGTRPDRYVKGIGRQGLPVLKEINDNWMPAATEIQTEHHLDLCRNNVSFVWIGSRSCQNYGLLESASDWTGGLMIKRGFGMTIDEVIGLYDIMKDIHKKKVYIIERGINTFDRKDDMRWAPDLRGVIELKYKRYDLFQDLIIDCSHSMGRKEYIKDCYDAFKAVGCLHYMFECTIDGISKTDQTHMLTTRELKEILHG